MVCGCKHLTDFMAFVQASYSPLLKFNYMAFTVLPSLTWHSLSSNTGFFVCLTYFGTFLLFLLTGSCTEKRKSDEANLELLIEELNIPRLSKYSQENRED